VPRILEILAPLDSAHAASSAYDKELAQVWRWLSLCVCRFCRCGAG
jgi:hypothetical protein